MEEPYLYQKIVDSIRQDILSEKYSSGDRLPTVRETAAKWDCTLGTVQRAYAELGRQGLVISRAGQGTHVVESPPEDDDTPLRKASLVNRAEAFLLESITSGYSPEEVETALRLAMDHWRVTKKEPARIPAKVLRFSGSHDLAITWIAAHFSEIAPHYALQLDFTGSLGGLIALAEGKADLAGCHLWDQETDSYNTPFVHRVLPGQWVALLTLAHRSLGLIVPAGNPATVTNLDDLVRPELRFVNRQAGSGTRVWLDSALRSAAIQTSEINGFNDVRITHSEVTRTIAEGQAQVGFGLQTAAVAFGLDFIPLVHERYDLIIPEKNFEMDPVQGIIKWLISPEARQPIVELGGYDFQDAGKVEWI
jgi:putative molybdopterin biosynthesis protein